MASIYKEQRQGRPLRYVCEFRNRAGRRIARRFAQLKDAKAYRSEIETQLSEGTYRDAGRTTVHDLLKMYTDHMAERCERGEQCTEQHLANIKSHIAVHLQSKDYGLSKKLKLRDLSQGQVQTFADSMRRAGISPTTTRKVVGTLRKSLDFAAGLDLVSVNVAKGVSVRSNRADTHRRVTIPSPAEVRTLIRAANDDMSVRIMFAAFVGTRASEQWALRWSDIDLHGGTVDITKAVNRKGEIHPNKSRAGRRTMHLNSALVAKLKEHKLRSPFSKADDLVFPNQEGGYTSHDNWRSRHFTPFAEGLGIKLRWHDLRHFFVSTLIDQGMNVKKISAYAGHANIATTLNTYGHLLEKGSDRDAFDQVAADLL